MNDEVNRRLAAEGDTPEPLFPLETAPEPAPVPVNRESWAHQLEWLCRRIVEAVHQPRYEHERQTEIARAVGMACTLTPPAGKDPVEAVIVTLAAMVPVLRDREAALEWVSAWGDELDRVEAVS